MRTTQPSLCPASVTGTIWTYEGDDLPIEIDYEYYKENDLFGAFCYQVTFFDYKVLGTTGTDPVEIINQVKDIIREELKGLTVEFN
jgi:hypothetical protein